jgi:uncharacterized membrane protein YtjA (UPF0391 family)
MKKWKWLIIEVGSIVAGVLGFYFWSQLGEPSVIALLAMIFGLYGAGYAAARIDDIVGPIRIHVQVENWRPHIKITPIEPRQ